MKGHAMSPDLAKCSCSHCAGHLEFDTAYAGEWIACPHCGKETLLYIPGTATAPPTPSPVPALTDPAVQSAYRLADATAPCTLAPRPTAAPLRNTPPRNPNPFARQAAKASWISFIFAYGFGAMLRGLKGTPQHPFFVLTALLFTLVGVTLGIIALRGIRKHGRKGILMPAVVGIVLNGAVLLAAILGVLLGPSKRHELHETAASASSSTQSVTAGKIPVEPTAERPPRPGEPIVTLLEPGAEPRTLLRLRPKAGDKQIVAFRMKMAMDLSPLTNLPPITVTMQIAIKKVSVNGDIDYERVITDVSVRAGSGPTDKVIEPVRAAFSKLKGLTTSGVVSSRGFSRRTEPKSPKSDKVLPAIVRLFQAQMSAGLDIIAAPLPEEAVGAGGKWEVKPAEESQDSVAKVVCEIVSIEEHRVTAKLTVTVSASKLTPKDLAITGGGSGEMTIDLVHIMPAKGNLVYRVEMSGNDKPGGPNVTLKMQTDLRIEAKLAAWQVSAASARGAAIALQSTY
jgi:hypothetical protein